jgi:hypothetical protein
MKSDAEEILDEIEDIINVNGNSHETVVAIVMYLHHKRLEFVQPQGDCV